MTEETKKPLFTVTEDLLETGMRGFPVGYCPTSFIDPEKGLYYRGIPIRSLCDKTPEEAIFLLFYGKLPSEAELANFSKELTERAEVATSFFERMSIFSFDCQPMKVFSAALLLADTLYATSNWEEDALNLIAKAPIIAGGVLRYLQGKNHTCAWDVKKATQKPTWTERLIESLGPELIPEEKRTVLTELIGLFTVLHMDHGGGNLSTFVGKAIASGLEDMYGSLAGAMLALDGPRHGRANQDCLEFLEQLVKTVGTSPDPEAVGKVIRERIAEGNLIYGFGHAVLRVEDPRATVLYQQAEERYVAHPLVNMALLLRKVVPPILSENPKISDPYPNVDAISGALLLAGGLQYTSAIPVLFGCARIVGIARQIVYERTEARGGKGTPIIRPKYLYKDVGEASGRVG